MVLRESLNPDESHWDFIAVQLRRHREERRISETALGVMLDRDRSTVSRIEGGTIKLQEAHARRIDREWGTEGLFAKLVHIAKSAHNTEWLKTAQELEARAEQVRTWELGWIPGLLQTPEYARAIFTAYGFEDIDSLVDARMARQAILSRKPKPHMWAYLDQGVVEQAVGGAAVLREQLAKLLELAQSPNVTIRVVPRSAGAHPGRDGSFKIMTIGGADYVYTEASEGGRLTSDGTDVVSFRAKFTRISDWALPVPDSYAMIERLMEGSK